MYTHVTREENGPLTGFFEQYLIGLTSNLLNFMFNKPIKYFLEAVQLFAGITVFKILIEELHACTASTGHIFEIIF